MALPIRYDPYLRVSNWWNWMDRDFGRPARIFDQHFGIGVGAMENLPGAGSALMAYPEKVMMRTEKSGISEIQYDKDKWQVMLDIQHFQPKEIDVNYSDTENSISIHAHHDERQDEHGFITRSFTRRYILPEDVKIEHLECNLSSDGILIIKVPRIIQLQDEKRKIPIVQTGQPAFKPSTTTGTRRQRTLSIPDTAVEPMENVGAGAAAAGQKVNGPVEQERTAKGCA